MYFLKGQLEEAIEGCIGLAVEVRGASRTDAGTHAAGQVAHFDVPSQLNPER